MPQDEEGQASSGAVSAGTITRVPTLPRPLRENLGKAVRFAWIQCKREEEKGGTFVKAAHKLPWDRLDERNKEIDRRIGEAAVWELMTDASMPDDARPLHRAIVPIVALLQYTHLTYGMPRDDIGLVCDEGLVDAVKDTRLFRLRDEKKGDGLHFWQWPGNVNEGWLVGYPVFRRSSLGFEISVHATC